jgi:3'-5' exoribonuclease
VLFIMSNASDSADSRQFAMVAGLRELREASAKQATGACVLAQVESAAKKESANGKPYFEVRLRDVADALVLRVWSDHQGFLFCESLNAGDILGVEGEFAVHPNYGLEARRWRFFLPTAEETSVFLAGDPATVAAVEADYDTIAQFIDGLHDPRLRALGRKFLEVHGEKFQRAAAARTFHHARRGGLCAHVAQMMRSADALAGAYPTLNRDLLLAGILFHDAGKLWETCPPAKGFDIPVQLPGEMLGHITIGIELINHLWSGLSEERETWAALQPESEHVRLHLLHLVASHHGELQFGSPVEPRTPEAIALHYIDNLDAKLEMLREGYASAPEVAPGITERVRPLNHRLVFPLPVFAESENPTTAAEPNPSAAANEESA